MLLATGCLIDPLALGLVTDGASSATEGSTGGTGTGSTGTTTGENLDVGATGTTGVDPGCSIDPDGDGKGACDKEAPPASFSPAIQWLWEGDGDISDAVVPPLVANLTDDNGDGLINLCDTPDVVVVASENINDQYGFLYVLAGDTGEVLAKTEEPVFVSVTPAIGDVDGDGVPEIVAARAQSLFGNIITDLSVWEGDGTLVWSSDQSVQSGGSIGLADFEGDGDVEIYVGATVWDHLGADVFAGSNAMVPPRSASVAIDLDGDEDLELVVGATAFHHDGSLYYDAITDAGVTQGFPQVANLDTDVQPEILVTTSDGFWILEHDGSVKLGPLTPTGVPTTDDTWFRPATIHDFDSDGLAEFGQAAGSEFATFERDGTLRWTAPIDENIGFAGGTAFDFLGDGGAEAMFADQSNISVFDEAGAVVFQRPRTSTTLTEFPVVADVDNDGSAEIIVTSNRYMVSSAPTVQVLRDKEDRWIQARRIWNQHAYHVTNVNEDGTIPPVQRPHWLDLNSFRTNAQIEDGQTCVPPPRG